MYFLNETFSTPFFCLLKTVITLKHVTELLWFIYLFICLFIYNTTWYIKVHMKLKCTTPFTFIMHFSGYTVLNSLVHIIPRKSTFIIFYQNTITSETTFLSADITNPFFSSSPSTTWLHFSMQFNWKNLLNICFPYWISYFTWQYVKLSKTSCIPCWLQVIFPVSVAVVWLCVSNQLHCFICIQHLWFCPSARNYLQFVLLNSGYTWWTESHLSLALCFNEKQWYSFGPFSPPGGAVSGEWRPVSVWASVRCCCSLTQDRHDCVRRTGLRSASQDQPYPPSAGVDQPARPG